ncbi:MAG: DUF2262 domain-containing protein [Hyphomicrobiaceae bacterium]
MMRDEPSDNPIAAVAARERRLIDKLAKSPVSELVGMIAPDGSAAGQIPPAQDWNFNFSLLRWRLVDGPVESNPIRIRKLVDATERDALMSRLKPWDMIALRAHTLNDAEFDGAQGLLVHLEDARPADPELESIRESLRQPVTYQHDEFGTFTFDRQFDWFEANTTWQHKPIKLNLSTDEREDHLASLLATAEALFARQDSWHERLTGYSAGKLLELKNEQWRDQNEPDLTSEDFVSRMALESITVYEGGQLEFYFDDGDLFEGHTILVSASLENGPSDVAIAG